MADYADWLVVAKGALTGDAPPDGCLPPLPGRVDRDPLPAPPGWHVTALIDAAGREAAATSVLRAAESGATAMLLSGAGTRAARRWRGDALAPAPQRGLADDAANLAWLLPAAPATVPVLLLEFEGVAAPLAMADQLERRNLNPLFALVRFGLDPITALTARPAATTAPAQAQAAAVWAARMHDAVALAGELKARHYAGPFLAADGRPYHEAGADAALELACTLAAAVVYVRRLIAAGWPAPQAFASMSFTQPVTVDWLETAAKLRALTVLWLSLQQLSGVTDPVPPVIHAETSWAMLLRQEPETNILRNTLAAFGAVLGGCGSLTVLPHTALLTPADPAAERLALTLQHVLAEEAQLRRTLDPVAGSGALEAATDRIADAAWTTLQSLEGTRDGLPLLVADLLDGGLLTRIDTAAAGQAPRRILGVTDYADGPFLAAAAEPVPMLLPARRWSNA